MIKCILILCGRMFSLVAMRADLVLRQHIESAKVNGTLTTQINILKRITSIT